MSFHVPESARNTTHPLLATSRADGHNGMFQIASPEPGWFLALICSDGTEPDPTLTEDQRAWEHVSVHAYRRRTGHPGGVQVRTPAWAEMAHVKRICWDPEDLVLQFHPRESEYVNCHPHVLHLWRWKRGEIPAPPASLVGPRPGVTGQT